MNSSSDAAESVIRISLQGFEVATKIAGTGAKHLAVIMYTILKDQKQTKGKTNLINMIKSGKELKVFGVKESDLKKFTEEAKRYGVLFTALVDKKHKSPDGLVDVMVRAEDASKINRIVERFRLEAVGTASIENSFGKQKIDKIVKEAIEKGIEVKSVEEKLVDDILSKPIKKEENDISNPQLAKTEKSPLSEPSSKSKSKCEEGTKSNKPSVRQVLKEIKQEQQKEKDLEIKDTSKTKIKNQQEHKQHRGKRKKIRERG